MVGIGRVVVGIIGASPPERRMPAQKFRDLVIYKQSILLCEEVYRIVRVIPQPDRFLARDMCNSVLVAMTKMSRGYANVSTHDRHRSFSRSFGKLARLDFQLTLIRRMELVPDREVMHCHLLLDEVRRLLEVLENGWYDS
jgi:four helix bundle protein